MRSSRGLSKEGSATAAPFDKFIRVQLPCAVSGLAWGSALVHWRQVCGPVLAPLQVRPGCCERRPSEKSPSHGWGKSRRISHPILPPGSVAGPCRGQNFGFAASPEQNSERHRPPTSANISSTRHPEALGRPPRATSTYAFRLYHIMLRMLQPCSCDMPLGRNARDHNAMFDAASGEHWRASHSLLSRIRNSRSWRPWAAIQGGLGPDRPLFAWVGSRR